MLASEVYEWMLILMTVMVKWTELNGRPMKMLKTQAAGILPLEGTEASAGTS